MRAPFSPPASQELRVVASRRRRAGRRRRIVGIGRRALERAEHDRRVGDRARHRSGGVVIGGDRNHAVAADAADRRPDADQHVRVRRADDRAAGVGADVGRPETRGGADAGARSAGLQRRAAVERRLARIGPRIVRVVAEAADRVVVARHRVRRAGDPVGELGQPGLGDDDRAGVAQVLRQRRLVRRHVAGERQRAAGRRHVGGVDVVLQRDRDAVQRTAQLAGGALAIERVGLLERARVDDDRRVQAILVGAEPHQILTDERARRQPARRHRRAHLRDRRFDDVKRFEPAAVPARARRLRRQRDGEDGGERWRQSACLSWAAILQPRHNHETQRSRRDRGRHAETRSLLVTFGFCEFCVVRRHSARSAIIGSTRVARRAGTSVATSDTTVTSAATAP